MFILSLKKNIIFVVVLEDFRYDVIFNNGKEFLRHIAMGQVKHMRVQFKKLYELEVEDACITLMSKEAIRDMVIEREHDLPLKMEPQKEPKEVVEQPQIER